MLEKQESRVTASEMKFLRKIVNKTRRDRIRNTVIREEVKVEPVIQTIQKHALRWFGYITRMRGQEDKAGA